MTLTRWAFLLGLLSAPAAAEEPAGVPTQLPQPAGIARLVVPRDAPDAPLVVILPDALGDDGRAEPYVASLLARGIATLLLGLGEDRDGPGPADDPAASPEALTVVRDWAIDTAHPHARIGVLGFGLGARAALAAAIVEPVAALYPRCVGLPVPMARRALILQGEASAEGCDVLDLPDGVALRMLPGAGHGWDVPGAIWPSPGPLLPDPAGGARLLAVMELQATLRAAERVADWFEDLLIGEARPPPR